MRITPIHCQLLRGKPVIGRASEAAKASGIWYVRSVTVSVHSAKGFLMRRFFPALMLFAAVSLPVCSVSAEEIGDVSTAFRWLGKNDRVALEVYDDPKVEGVSCYVSRARTGGVKGTVGLAEDKSEASIACRQVGATITFKGKLPVQEDVFTERMSILFKRLHIVRVVDAKRNTLVYLTYSDKLIDGSPMNAVTAVPVPLSTPIPVK